MGAARRLPGRLQPADPVRGLERSKASGPSATPCPIPAWACWWPGTCGRGSRSGSWERSTTDSRTGPAPPAPWPGPATAGGSPRSRAAGSTTSRSTSGRPRPAGNADAQGRQDRPSRRGRPRVEPRWPQPGLRRREDAGLEARRLAGAPDPATGRQARAPKRTRCSWPGAADSQSLAVLECRTTSDHQAELTAWDMATGRERFTWKRPTSSPTCTRPSPGAPTASGWRGAGRSPRCGPWRRRARTSPSRATARPSATSRGTPTAPAW